MTNSQFELVSINLGQLLSDHARRQRADLLTTRWDKTTHKISAPQQASLFSGSNCPLGKMPQELEKQSNESGCGSAGVCALHKQVQFGPFWFGLAARFEPPHLHHPKVDPSSPLSKSMFSVVSEGRAALIKFGCGVTVGV